jgi:hypothetical protein
MPKPETFDLTPDDREEMQCVIAELDMHPEKRPALIAELVLLRKLFSYTRQYRHRFPPRLQQVIHALGHRPELARASADSISELAP